MGFDWKETLSRIPHEPGVYLMRDRRGRLIYVGKAADLQARLRSYASGSGDTRPFVALLDALLGEVETILTGSAKEALLLENHLIKKHQPRFNVRLKDDKSFLLLRLDARQPYPRLEVVRRRGKDGALYFGPYDSARSIRETLRRVHRHFQIRNCSDSVFRNRARPCLQYQIGRCLAPCVKDVPPEVYGRKVDDVRLFLEGRVDDLTARLRREMKTAADTLDFERAARLRDQVAAVERSLQGQQVDMGRDQDIDVLGWHREGTEVTVQVIEVRRGLLTASRAFHLPAQPFPDPEILHDFVLRYYDGGRVVPDLVLLPFAVEEQAPLEDWLCETRGRRTELRVPQRGRLRRLAELAAKNAEQSFRAGQAEEDARARLLTALQRRLGLESFPERIECYDISQLQGGEAVGSRVVFEWGEPATSQYRHYRIRDVDGQNDFAMMYEVLARRFQPSRGEPDPYPCLLVVDGGVGQLNVARAVLEELGVDGVELAGLAKARVVGGDPDEAPERSPERVFLPGRKNPVVLPAGAPERYLLERVRDEAHRFAITFHRQTRRRRTLGSALDEIPGVGPGRRRAVLKHFGSLDAVRKATLAELEAVPGLPARVAAAIHEHVHKG